MKNPDHIPEPSALPTVAIVGRPNVGKSAIFNRLTGRRIAIVHEQSGVTRDRLCADAAWGDVRFQLVDTGGLPNVPGARPLDEIEDGIRRQIEAALADAAIAMIVVDVEAGVAGLDKEVAALVRRSGVPAVIAANKCDAPARDALSAEFSRLGFPVFPVSALHNLGFEALMDRVVRDLPRLDAPPLVSTAPLRIAVVGRPNVGKSSYVNRFLRAERVIVSNVPGTTVDSIDIPFMLGSGPTARHYILTDTAGLRPKPKIRTSLEHFSLNRVEQSIERADVVLLLLDATQGPTAQDKKIASLIQGHAKGCVVLVNKWDLAEGRLTQRQYEPALRHAVPFLDYAPVVFVSTQTGFNIRKTVEAIDHVAAQVRKPISTGVLNRAILRACQRLQPPMIRGKRLKIYYATQIGTAPIRIALFVNDAGRLTPAYSSFLIRCLREDQGLEGAPVLLELKAKQGGRHPD